MKKKLIIMFSIMFAIVIIAIPAFAWFYFPNSKGVELNTADAEDVNIKLYKLFNEYDENGIYKNSYMQDLKNETYKNESNEDVPYFVNPNSFKIPSAFEFFEWGDEYICEDDTTDYYAIECDYDSDVFNDGYVKSLLSTTLKSKGGVYKDNENEDDLKIAFPIVNLSYKFATQYYANADGYIIELKNNSNYNLITERYYLKNGNSYDALDAATYEDYDSQTGKIYKKNLTEFTGNTFEPNTTYYKYEHVINPGSSLDNGIFRYSIADTYQPGNKYYTGTFEEMSGLDVKYSNDSTYRYIFEDVHSNVFNTLNKVQYVTNNKLKFVILIKVEPNTDLVSSVMNAFRDDIQDDLTEISIDNDIEFKINIRSVPKKEGTIE